MTIEVALSGSTLIAVIILAVQLGSLKEQHRVMWEHFQKFVVNKQ